MRDARHPNGSAGSLLGAIAVFTLAGVAAPAAPGQVQGANVPEYSTYELFPQDRSEPRPEALRLLADALRQAGAPGDCPLGRLKIRTPATSDPLFAEALAKARQDEILAALDRVGIPVGGRLFVESTVFGEQGGHDAAFEVAADREPPMLKTTSEPRKGTRVKAGDRIAVTMSARDSAGRWNTGIKTIQLVADSEGGRFIESQNYEPCAEPMEHRVETIYQVPASPPLIVRLTALAEDHAGLKATDAGEFPTAGDWYGSVEVSVTSPTVLMTSRLDITIDYDGRGNLTGRAEGHSVMTKTGGYECPFASTPAGLSAKVVGQYTPGTNAMSLALTEPTVVKGHWECTPPQGLVPVTGEHGAGIIDQPLLGRLLRNLTISTNGSLDVTDEDLSIPEAAVRARLTLDRTHD